MGKHIVLLLCLLFVGGLGSFSQSPSPFNLRFQYLTTADGLPQNTIDCIFLDSQGFMWFGTWNGLCRYDGYSFKVFQKSDSQKSLPDNFVHAICEDKNKNLWVGTAHGVIIYHLETEQFFMPDSLQVRLGKMAVTSLACDKNGGMWVAGEKGKIFHVSPKPEKKQQFECNEINTKALLNADVKSVYVSKTGRVLIGTGVGPYEVINRELHPLEFTGPVWDLLKSANILCLYGAK